MDRDYIAEMRALIDLECESGPYISRLKAIELVNKLRARDPEFLQGYLDRRAEELVWREINDRDRSNRAHARATAGRSVFAGALEAHASGDPIPLSGFLGTRYAVADGSRRRLADLRAADLRFVAEGYERRARENAMCGAFLLALARKIDKGRVEDHFTERDLTVLWNSLTSTGGAAPAAA